MAGNVCRPCFLNPTLVPSLTLFRLVSEWVKVAQSCPTLCNPMDCPWNSPDQNTGVGSLSLLQGIFSTQGSNPGLPHCRQILRWEAPNFTNHDVFRQCFSTQAAELPNNQTPTSNLGTIKSESRSGIFSASPQWFQWATQAKDTIFIDNFCFPFLLGKLHKRTAWLHHRGPASWVGRICSTHFGFNEILPVKLSNWVGGCVCVYVCVCVCVCVWQPTSVALMKSCLWSYLIGVCVCVCARVRVCETTNLCGFNEILPVKLSNWGVCVCVCARACVWDNQPLWL